MRPTESRYVPSQQLSLQEQHHRSRAQHRREASADNLIPAHEEDGGLGQESTKLLRTTRASHAQHESTRKQWHRRACILPQSNTGTSRLTLTQCTCRTVPTRDRCCRDEHPDAKYPVSAELGELRTQSPCAVTVFAPPSATTASNHNAEALCPRPTNQDEYTDEKILPLCLDGAATIPSAFPTESNWRCTGRNGPLSSRHFSAKPWRRVSERSSSCDGSILARALMVTCHPQTVRQGRQASQSTATITVSAIRSATS